MRELRIRYRGDDQRISKRPKQAKIAFKEPFKISL
jgi:hypothetical protein